MTSGWHNESYRHKLAANGVKTNMYMSRKNPSKGKGPAQRFPGLDLHKEGVTLPGRTPKSQRVEELAKSIGVFERGKEGTQRARTLHHELEELREKKPEVEAMKKRLAILRLEHGAEAEESEEEKSLRSAISAANRGKLAKEHELEELQGVTGRRPVPKQIGVRMATDKQLLTSDELDLSDAQQSRIAANRRELIERGEFKSVPKEVLSKVPQRLTRVRYSNPREGLVTERREEIIERASRQQDSASVLAALQQRTAKPKHMTIPKKIQNKIEERRKLQAMREGAKERRELSSSMEKMEDKDDKEDS